jgi:Zn-dependent protease
MLGLFNMIPFGILDGQNIWKWSKKVYITLIVPLTVLLVITLISIYAPVGSNPYIPI